jgi:hypothetical protein
MVKGWDKAAQSTKRFIALKVTGYHFPSLFERCMPCEWFGGLAERSNAVVLKTTLLETVTGVRIPEPPLKFLRSLGKTKWS